MNVIISDILQIQNAVCTQMWLWASFLLLALLFVNLLCSLVNLLGANSENEEELRNSGFFFFTFVPGELSWGQPVLGSP